MAIKKRPVSPRQKMINLMYVILMAMLALNVSAEVLDAFSLLEGNIKRTTVISSKENMAIYRDFSAQMKANPEKVTKWFDMATDVRSSSDSLCNFIESLKQAIAIKADGSDADLSDIKAKDDLEAANQVMLAPRFGKGEELHNRINMYRNRMLDLIDDSTQRSIIMSSLSTDVPQRDNTMGKNWQEYMFENIPAAAALTLLSKIQGDIRYTEGEVLHSLKANIDAKDIKVNALSAFVIPESKTVFRGGKFSARIAMAAIDTTMAPEIFIGNKKVFLNNGIYESTCLQNGTFNLNGYLKINDANGEEIKRYFSQTYNVIEPNATVAADMMNVLYAGYANPISISVPGVPLSSVQATMVGGSLLPKGIGKYIARPNRIGSDVKIIVTTNYYGRTQTMGTFSFHVRRLPDPTPYIIVGGGKGNSYRFKGGSLQRSSLIAANGINAAIDDGLLDIKFRVLGFETVFFDNMGNALPMASNGSQFSSRQIEAFRKLSKNRRLYISRIRVMGTDGIERRLNSPMEIIIR